MGAHAQDDLEAAITMTQRLEVYRGGDRAKVGRHGKRSKKYRYQNQKNGVTAQVEGSSHLGELSRQKIEAKGGQGGSVSGGKRTRRGGRRRVECHNCGGDHFLRDYK